MAVNKSKDKFPQWHFHLYAPIQMLTLKDGGLHAPSVLGLFDKMLTKL